VLWYGARLVVAGSLTSGELLVFLLYLGNMYKPMRELSKMTDTISKADVGWERIREVLENEKQVRDLPGAKPAPRFKGRIEFDHVRFAYNGNGPVLEDLSLQIEPGKMVALVGPTGAGKTTIVSLLPRFYETSSGQIRIDGTDIRRYRQKSLREQISFVLQETLLFRATVAQNIAYGNPQASHQEIVRAARLANADEFIDRMPDGYETMIGERGVTLSGGQRQRITIARAIIRDSPILILDEPSAGLDAESEKLVFDALENLMQGKTSIVIAHRLATVRRADLIFVIDQGRVVEQGTHEELLTNSGLYSRLYELQFKGEEMDERELVTV
jgi:subfamily B ATP-binding cassette protein MsbA